jgi:uncharacterized protein (TIGR02001 family)
MNAIQRIASGAAAAFAVFALAAPAFAGGMKDTPEPRRCAFSANVGLTTEYVFRGFSQTAGGPAVQGGFDATCGMFYAGVWASNLDWDGVANIETDWYGGVKFNTGRIAWDLGVIYYAYPNNHSNRFGLNEPSYVELKVGASTEIWKGGTLGVTGYWSPDYTFESGSVATIEGSFSQTLPTIFGRVTPTFSALVGYQKGFDQDYKNVNIANGDNNYVYWNAGVAFAFDKNWSLDLRYWDTNVSNSGGFCDPGQAGPTGALINQCDARYVATLKFTY